MGNEQIKVTVTWTDGVLEVNSEYSPKNSERSVIKEVGLLETAKKIILEEITTTTKTPTNE